MEFFTGWMYNRISFKYHTMRVCFTPSTDPLHAVSCSALSGSRMQSGGVGVPQRRFAPGGSSPGSAMVAAAVSMARAEQAEAASPAAAAAASTAPPGESSSSAAAVAPALVEADGDGRPRVTPYSRSLHAAAAGVAAATRSPFPKKPDSERGTATPEVGGQGQGGEAGAVYPTGRPASSIPLVLPDDLAGETSDGDDDNARRPRRRAESSPALTPTGSGRSASESTWSSLSARGMTPSSLAPLGPTLDWADGGGGGAVGGGSGGGIGGASHNAMGMSASLAGFAGYKSALLEARRAEVAEEQGEFWQGRACAAEAAKGRLEKVIDFFFAFVEEFFFPDENAIGYVQPVNEAVAVSGVSSELSAVLSSGM